MHSSFIPVRFMENDFMILCIDLHKQVSRTSTMSVGNNTNFTDAVRLVGEMDISDLSRLIMIAGARISDLSKKVDEPAEVSSEEEISEEKSITPEELDIELLEYRLKDSRLTTKERQDYIDEIHRLEQGEIQISGLDYGTTPDEIIEELRNYGWQIIKADIHCNPWHGKPTGRAAVRFVLRRQAQNCCEAINNGRIRIRGRVLTCKMMN